MKAVGHLPSDGLTVPVKPLKDDWVEIGPIKLVDATGAVRKVLGQ